MSHPPLLSTSCGRPLFLAISFSGGGHLLPYHLGVSSSLLRLLPDNNTTTRYAVSGSSAGAIAATLHSLILPTNNANDTSSSSSSSLHDYCDRFIEDKGRGLYHLEQMLLSPFDQKTRTEKDDDDGDNETTPTTTTKTTIRSRCSLHIATTKCSDASPHLFSFFHHGRSAAHHHHDRDATMRLLTYVKASCTIPPSFHPFDVLPSRRVAATSYPLEEGVKCDDGGYHVDGGIAAPAPSTPWNEEEIEGCVVRRVVVSPIAGGDAKNCRNDDDDEDVEFRISPKDDSWRLLPTNDVMLKGGFGVRPSLRNLISLRVSAGICSRDELRDWWRRGVEDGETFVENNRSWERQRG